MAHESSDVRFISKVKLGVDLMSRLMADLAFLPDSDEHWLWMLSQLRVPSGAVSHKTFVVVGALAIVASRDDIPEKWKNDVVGALVGYLDAVRADPTNPESEMDGKVTEAVVSLLGCILAAGPRPEGRSDAVRAVTKAFVYGSDRTATACASIMHAWGVALPVAGPDNHVFRSVLATATGEALRFGALAHMVSGSSAPETPRLLSEAGVLDAVARKLRVIPTLDPDDRELNLRFVLVILASLANFDQAGVASLLQINGVLTESVLLDFGLDPSPPNESFSITALSLCLLATYRCEGRPCLLDHFLGGASDGKPGALGGVVARLGTLP